MGDGVSSHVEDRQLALSLVYASPRPNHGSGPLQQPCVLASQPAEGLQCAIQYPVAIDVVRVEGKRGMLLVADPDDSLVRPLLGIQEMADHLRDRPAIPSPELRAGVGAEVLA
jgi:hypothetical protein